ncbi:MAG: histidinol-phosphate transaminase [Hahellaceae bacterium]|nr:histidinol-phosphate transaminase [Hahellaceae bacterium]
MSNPYLSLAISPVHGVSPYVPGRPAESLQRELGLTSIVKLASNENPLGPAPAVFEAIQRASRELGRYPDGGGFRLKAKLSQRLGLAMEAFTLGNGSNDVLEIIGRTFAGAGDEVIYSDYAFAVYGLVTQISGATAVVVPAKDWGHDLDAMAAAVTSKTKLIYLANPNNPTGTCFDNDALQGFLARVPERVLVVLDEAYFEYFEDQDRPDGISFLARYPNLIVCRTFSKAYGLAALRLGYAVSHPGIAELLNRVRQPFNVNTLAQEAGLVALDDDMHLQKSVELNRQGMQQLTEGLAGLNLTVIPSRANFLTVQVGRAAEINRALLNKGVIVRPLDGYGMSEWLRVSIGLAEENQRFLEALTDVLAELGVAGH